MLIAPSAQVVLRRMETPGRNHAGDARDGTGRSHRLRLGVGGTARPSPAGELGEGAPDRLGLKVRAVASHTGPEV
eukprot:11705017-Alexandrium_andersonii.AAC.1